MSSPKSTSSSRAPPLAGRPPFATDNDDDDEPASFYETPRAPMTPSRVQFAPLTPMTPTQRIRAQMILPAAIANTAEREKRTSAYDVYDDYISASASSSSSTSKPSSSTSRSLTPTKPTNPFSTPLDSPSHPSSSSSSSSSKPTTNANANANRTSGIGALLMAMSDSDSELDSDDDDAREAEIKRGTMTKNTLVGAGASNNKNAALAAAVGSPGGAGKVKFAVPVPPVPVVQQQQPRQQQQQPHPPPQHQGQGQQQQPMKIAAPQPGYAAPIATLNLGQPFGPGKNPFEPAEQSRNPFIPPGSDPSMPQLQPHPQGQHGQRPEMVQVSTNASGRTIPLPAPLRIVPPPINTNVNMNPFDQQPPYTPYTPFSPHSGNKPQTPHPLLPPVTPITPAFIRPAKSMSMSSGGSGGSGGGGTPGGGGKVIPPPAAIKFDERMVVPIKESASPRPRNPNRADDGKRDDFWRRFSMVARKDEVSPNGSSKARSSARPSSWLATSRASTSRYTRTVWVVGMLLVFGIIAGIGCGVYFTKGNPDHQLPKTIGGSADQAATYSSTATAGTAVGGTGKSSSTLLHVSPTRIVAREVVVQTGVPVLEVVEVGVRPSPRSVHHLRMLEKREW